MKDELNIMDLVDMLMRRWWIMLVSMLLVGVMAFVFTEVFISPSYRSEGALYVNSTTDQQINQTLTSSIITRITAARKYICRNIKTQNFFGKCFKGYR